MSPVASAFKHTVPAKWIISGEHANVYGADTLASSINRHLSIHTQPSDNLTFTLPEVHGDATQVFSADDALSHYLLFKAKHAQYQNGSCAIEHVLAHPCSLMLATLGAVLYRCPQASPRQGAVFSVESTIPVGCGLGSSSACILAMLRSLKQLWKLKLSDEVLLDCARDIEHLKHGQSSGNDLRILQHEGLVHIHQNRITPLTPPASWHWYAVHTGEPRASTGACVQHARVLFKAQPQRIRSIQACTEQWLEALKKNKLALAMDAMKKNHRLLCALGVVPQAIQTRIQAYERAGMAAKITGAGSTQGDAAGALMLLSPAPLNLNDAHTEAVIMTPSSKACTTEALS
jgi:mevalonate kinase